MNPSEVAGKGVELKNKAYFCSLEAGIAFTDLFGAVPRDTSFEFAVLFEDFFMVLLVAAEFMV